MNNTKPQHTIITHYWLGDTVFHRLATECSKGMITGINLCPDGLYYWVTWSDRHETKHYEFELTSEYVPDYESSE